jgi:hypothetical protein
MPSRVFLPSGDELPSRTALFLASLCVSVLNLWQKNLAPRSSLGDGNDGPDVFGPAVPRGR